MTVLREAQLLRVFLGETDKIDGRPVYEQLVLRARQFGLAGATVLRGVLGFGAHSRLHSAKVLHLAEDLPVVVEIIDAPERLAGFLPIVQELAGGGLITLERAQVVSGGPDSKAAGTADEERA